jgi:hypothetical protein
MMVFEYGTNMAYRYTGTSWTPVGSGFPTQLVYSFGGPNNQLYVTDWTNTFRSTDGGATFTPFLTGYNNIKWDPSRPETAYLWRAYSRPERTLSSGTHIGTFSDGLPQTGELRGHFAIDANGTTVYTTVSFKGIYRITD